MKNLILTIAAIALASVSYAQTPVTDSSGGGTGTTAPLAQEVANLPGSPASANRGISIQTGNAHKVMVSQIGTRQSATIDQGDGSTGIGENEALVIQRGMVNPPTSGVRNAAEVLQDGSNNETQLRQNGDRNNAVAHQGQNNDLSSGNKSAIRQGSNTAQQAEGNAAFVEQDGKDNEARLTQTFDNNSATTDQNGESNLSSVNQNGGPNQTFGHRALTTQDGDFNESTIDQSGDGAENDAETHQLGDNNQAWQVQTTDAASPASAGNNALANQGDESRRDNSTLTATIGSDLATILGSEAGAGPSGDGSEAGIAVQMQGGTRNTAESHQFGDIAQDSNYSEQRQVSGNNNDAYIVQNAFGNAASGDNYGYQLQEGDNNSAGLSQRGNSHKAAQRQDGNNNEALSSQRGQDNNVNVNQFGDNNVGHTNQDGSNNQILLNQNDGQSWTANQNLGQFGSAFGGNSARIFQSTPGGTQNDPACTFDPQVVMPTFTPIAPLALDLACPDC